MTEAVVDLLEPVEIDEQHRQCVVRSLGSGERLVEPVVKQRAVGKSCQTVVKRLVAQLLLESNPLGDVARVEHDTAELPVGAQVGDMGLEVPPFPESVLDQELDLTRFPTDRCGFHQRPIVGVHGAHEPGTEHTPLGLADHSRDRPARITAFALAENEHEVGGRRDEAPEVGCLPPRCRDQAPPEKHGDEDSRDAQGDLELDQVADIPVRTDGDGPGRVQRHVRRKSGEHAQPADRIRDRDVLVRRLGYRLDRTSSEQGASGRGQIGDEPALLRQLGTNHRSAGRLDDDLVVVSVDRRCGSSVQQRARALAQQRRQILRIGLDAGAREEHLLHVALRERPLSGGHLYDRRSMLGTLGCADRHPDARRREQGERREYRDDRAPAARRKRSDCHPPRHRYDTTSWVCMPPR